MPIIKILIAPNSFKECADSVSITQLFEKYLSPNENLEVYGNPISDGGDGFLNTLKYNGNLTPLNFSITTPFDDSKFICEVLYDEQNSTIYIESAKVLGLELIPKEKRHPLSLSSKGMGELLLQLNNSESNKDLDVKNVIVGIGGTGTNDLGLGMCSVLGLKLLDKYEKELRVIPKYFADVNKIIWSKLKFPYLIKTIIDVNNPLLGKFGASRQFAKQKGADNDEINQLEYGFENIINLLNNNKIEGSSNQLSGAGGGLAAGFSLFFDAQTISSFDNILTHKNLINYMEQADLVITGEGSFDDTSLLGKGASAVIKLAEKHKKNIILCCGKISKSSIMKYKNIIPIELNNVTKGNDYKKYIEDEIKIACNQIKKQIDLIDL